MKLDLWSVKKCFYHGLHINLECVMMEEFRLSSADDELASVSVSSRSEHRSSLEGLDRDGDNAEDRSDTLRPPGLSASPAGHDPLEGEGSEMRSMIIS